MRSRPFVVLFGAVLVASMGISMVSPILPVYAEDLGATGIWIGLTFSVFAVSQTLISPFAGRWSDRYGRKPFIILGLLCYLIAAFGYLTADSFLQVLAFRAFSGCGTSLIFAVGQAYIGDIVRAEKGVLYDIGGVEDHVHMYLRWRPDGSISDLMRTVKARSSKWVHDTYPNLAVFAWQEGYSVFSVSKSQEEAVKKYIAGQAEHHKKEDFTSELLRILRAHGIEFDEKYVFG